MYVVADKSHLSILLGGIEIVKTRSAHFLDTNTYIYKQKQQQIITPTDLVCHSTPPHKMIKKERIQQQ